MVCWSRAVPNAVIMQEVGLHVDIICLYWELSHGCNIVGLLHCACFGLEITMLRYSACIVYFQFILFGSPGLAQHNNVQNTFSFSDKSVIRIIIEIVHSTFILSAMSDEWPSDHNSDHSSFSVTAHDPRIDSAIICLSVMWADASCLGNIRMQK